MTTTARDQVGVLLSAVGAPGAFSARRTVAADDLHVEVKGLGPLRFPVSRKQAQQLCRLARPARYGQGERTLLDSGVRDTWEIPKSRVKIDRRRWHRTLLPVLERLRADLGLPDGCRLKPELHSMLVYGPGQFFLPHQDSEKTDEMIGTLVVTLPSSFKGGAFVIEHQGKKKTYRASPKSLSFVAFYADCYHEVRPVKEGYRIVLTYNLMLEGDGPATTSSAAEGASATIAALVEGLREHFETPLPPRWSREQDAPLREPPNRLVYLLDHQYTQRGLGWNRLKGDDAARVAVLHAAAERAGCEMVLALAEVHETWSCFEPGWDEPWYGYRRGRYRRWTRDEEDEEWTGYEDPASDPDAYELQDLIDWSIILERWIDPSGKEAEPIVARVDDEEVCSTIPSSALEPYASEYEGYMGNYGNTMDRWYRRGAAVLWPRKRAFAVRAEASPAWALKTLNQRLRTGNVTQAREMAKALLPFWGSAAPHEQRRGFFTMALRAAHGLDRSKLAASLLQPLNVEALTLGGAPAFVALVERYGERWARALLAEWSSPRRRWTRSQNRDRPTWLASLPRLCEALCAVDGSMGTPTARLLLEDSWRWLREAIEERRGLLPPSLREEALGKLVQPILSFLGSTAVAEARDLRDTAISFLCADENKPLLPSLVQLQRAAAKAVMPAKRTAAGLDAIGHHCARLLEARLAHPARDSNDWSIALPEGCHCELCGTLGAFLADPEQKRLEWPLAKQGRKHIHHRLDTHELPVRHETRRSGRPYTLVLMKTEALFEREAATRRSHQIDLAWLTETRG